MNNFTSYLETPIGKLHIEATEIAILSIKFVEENIIEIADEIHLNIPIIQNCVQQLGAYFEGKLKHFEIDLAPQGTDFQKTVWAELQKIPYGKTISYLELARRLGNQKVIRAAGTANGKNPIAIIIPCHRVIGADGTLVGYAGGLWRKKHLLELENGLSNKINPLFG
jgi:methylated-DNA-[protein]-cysteine S-methyltransferase